MKKYLVLPLFVLVTLFNSCDFIKGSLSNPTHVFTQAELKENIEKLQKSGDYKSIDEMEFWDITINFSHSNIESNCDIFAFYNLLDAEDKSKVINQTYHSKNSSFRKSYNIKIVDDQDNEVKDYTLFKDNLFKFSDLKQFNNIDNLQKQALASIENADDTYYVSSFSIICVPQIFYKIDLKNKKDVTFRKTVKFDDQGNIIK